MAERQVVTMIKKAYENMSEIFAATKQVKGHWLMLDGNGVLGLVPDFFNDKREMVRTMKEVLQVANATCYIHVAEAWSLKIDKPGQTAGDFKKEFAGRSLSEHPDAVEIVAFHGEDSLGFAQASCEIHRPKGGPASLGPLTMIKEDGTVEGLFVGLLPKLNKLQA